MKSSNALRPARRRRTLATVGVTALAVALIACGFALLPAVSEAMTPPTQAPTESAADGRIADDSRPTVFDDTVPAVANLDPDLLAALRTAARDAEADGISMHVNSGWRSEAYQQALLDEAVTRYGSADEAARWVATPRNSAHVTGDAVDLGPDPALDWLSQHGDRYGLCQIYANERWHYELRTDAVVHGCPQMYADPTEDPRMQS